MDLLKPNNIMMNLNGGKLTIVKLIHRPQICRIIIIISPQYFPPSLFEDAVFFYQLG